MNFSCVDNQNWEKLDMNFPTLAWRDEILYFTHYFAIVNSEAFLFFFSCGWIKHCWNTYASAYVRHQKNRKLWICANGKVLSEKIWLNHRYPSHWTIDGHNGKWHHWIGLQSMISGMQAEKYGRVSATALCSHTAQAQPLRHTVVTAS